LKIRQDKSSSSGIQRGSAPTRHPLVLLLLANARWIWPIAVIAIVIAITWSDLRNIQYRQFRTALQQVDPFWLAVAFLLTVGNLAVMGIYDIVCLRGTAVRAGERWWIGTLAFAWGCFLTFGPVAGPAVRFWLYRPFGVSFDLLRKAIAAIAVGFGCGLLLWIPFAMIPWPPGWTLFAIRAGMVFVAALFAGRLARKIQRWHRFPVWIQEMEVNWSALLMLGALDWLLAFLVFAACFHSAGISSAPGPLVRLYFVGQTLGVLSMVPGGLGSADAFWLAASDAMPGKEAAALLAYRVIYYLIPWSTATVLLLRRAVHGKVRWAEPGRWFVAAIVFLAGCLMLISSATPALVQRLQTLEKFVPLLVLETSHLASAIFGLFLCVLARGLMKGYRYAYRTTVALLLGGALGCTLNGLGYEVSILFVLTAALLWTHAKLFTLPSRIGGTAVAILTPIVLAIFVFAAAGFASYDSSQISRALSLLSPQALAYATEPARFLRTLGVLLLLGLLLAFYLLMSIPHHYVAPTREEIRRALAMHEKLGKGTNALRVANADKSILFLEEGGFCLYRSFGRYTVVYSDPSIEAGMERKCVGLLLQRAAELDRTLVFYQISAMWLPVLNDFGYSFFKLGEEAIVDLLRFDSRKDTDVPSSCILRRFRDAGFSFRIISADEVAGFMPALRAISDAWLRSKGVREKQFSIGSFDETYLSSYPCALLQDPEGKPVAFANILQRPNHGEFSIDLMRYLPDCPGEVRDLFLLRLIEWGRERNFRTFNLGLAPLAALGGSSQPRVGERMAKILFQHGEYWNDFRGIRRFKQKYDPQWGARYLAYPASWIWPQVILNVAALIAGGWRNVIFPNEKQAGGDDSLRAPGPQFHDRIATQ